MPDRRPKNWSQSNRPPFNRSQPGGLRNRLTDEREVLQRFLIVCEGEKTEPNYFKGFRVPQLVVDAVGTGHNTLSLVEEAIRLKGEKEAEAPAAGRSPYDQIWCVFDRNSFAADDFNNAIRKAEAAGFHVAYTNEAFELWYLLHFDDHRAALHRSQYHGILEDRLGHRYHKNSRTMYAELQNRQVEAIRRAESLLARVWRGPQPAAGQPLHNGTPSCEGTSREQQPKNSRNDPHPLTFPAFLRYPYREPFSVNNRFTNYATDYTRAHRRDVPKTP